MTDFRALCAELTENLALLDEPPHELVCRARAALAAEPQELTNEEMLARSNAALAQAEPAADRLEAIYRAIERKLEGTPRPIPVTERLPGAQDCDEGECCWLWNPDPNGHVGIGMWERDHKGWASDPNCDVTHWLPAHALPLPEVKE
jgi:hypothetical protein